MIYKLQQKLKEANRKAEEANRKAKKDEAKMMAIANKIPDDEGFMEAAKIIEGK